MAIVAVGTSADQLGPCATVFDIEGTRRHTQSFQLLDIGGTGSA